MRQCHHFQLHCINIHCMAHRLNLASSQAPKYIPFMKEVESTLAALFKYFGGSKSGNRKCALQEIQKVLDEAQLKIKECYEIRWLAFCEAVRIVYLCWGSLYTYFMENSSSETKTIMKVFQQFQVLGCASCPDGCTPLSGSVVNDLAKR